MTIKPYDFFREATLRICSSLDIATVMTRCLRYIKSVIPGEQLILTFYDKKMNAIRTVARVTSEKCIQEDILIQLPQKIDLSKNIEQMPREHICNDTEKEPFNDRMAKAYGLKGYSILQMFLETRDQKTGLGHLTLCTKGKGRYRQSDLDLFVLLKEPFTLASANILHHHQLLETNKKLTDDNRFLNRELYHTKTDTLIGINSGLKSVMTKVRQVAGKMSPVLLTGETGVGKDIIANMICLLSDRGSAPFIKVNCGAISDTLIDTELFGHEKGAFTGAVNKKKGKFERAHNGTIFLDEIGELPMKAQVKLLRVLQNREIERVGGTDLIEVDIRVIAATNRNLEAVLNKEFREDLWYRLNVFPIPIPPLRDRKMDIIPLANHFIEKKAVELQLSDCPELSTMTMDRLIEYHWPGNVRELENLIERSLIISQGRFLEIDPFTREKHQSSSNKKMQDMASLRLDDIIIGHIERVLNLTNGKIHGPGGAAELLDINSGTLRNRMNKLGIRYGRKRK